MNMKASDLMIGDWINPTFPMQVSAIGDNYADATFNGNEADDYQFADIGIVPIPLSDDWLDKFGFIKFKRGRLVWWALFFQNDARLRIEFIDDIYACTQVKRRIQYVHELQQLARAFTGEALTIKADTNNGQN